MYLHARRFVYRRGSSEARPSLPIILDALLLFRERNVRARETEKTARTKGNGGGEGMRRGGWVTEALVASSRICPLRREKGKKRMERKNGKEKKGKKGKS